MFCDFLSLALDKQIENGRKRLREAEAEYRSVKEEYCSVAFDYNKSMESLKKCFEKGRLMLLSI